MNGFPEGSIGMPLVTGVVMLVWLVRGRLLQEAWSTMEPAFGVSQPDRILLIYEKMQLTHHDI